VLSQGAIRGQTIDEGSLRTLPGMAGESEECWKKERPEWHLDYCWQC